MKAAKGPFYQDHANGKPPVPKPVSGMSPDEFRSAFKNGAIAAVSDETAKLSTENAFDTSTPEDERALAMHRKLGIKSGDRKIARSAEADLGIQEFDVSDWLGNAEPKHTPTISVLGSYDYDKKKTCTPLSVQCQGLGSLRLRTTRHLCNGHMDIEQERFACRQNILGR